MVAKILGFALSSHFSIGGGLFFRRITASDGRVELEGQVLGHGTPLQDGRCGHKTPHLILKYVNQWTYLLGGEGVRRVPKLRQL